MTLISYFLFSASYWFWNLFFFLFIQKSIFIIVNNKSLHEKPGASNIRKVYQKGGISDAIISSYLTAIPLIEGLVHSLIPSANLSIMMLPYNILAGVTLGLLCVSDALLYRFWNAKIDSSVFMYLRNLKGAFASVSSLYIITALFFVLLTGFVYFIGAQIISNFFSVIWSVSSSRILDYIGSPILFCLMIGLLVGVIRGLKIRPNNPSVVYFSPQPILNHWALNPGYNLIYSLGTKNDYAGKFKSMTDHECKHIIKDLFPKDGHTDLKLLNTTRPNILLIIWESFGARFCGALGGKPGVTPNFDKLSHEGILFTNCRSSSFRTDRALPAILCGLPGQPNASIVRHTRKLPNLPSFVRDLRDIGYYTTAIHGGDMTIMQKSDLYLSTGHDRIISQRDIDIEKNVGKWGIHDLEMAYLTADYIKKINTAHSPWLVTWQTLSSHEPFDVPFNKLADKEDNSMAYTDHAIGQLIESLKESGIWENLLVIINGDHGLNDADSSDDRNRYSHNPLLWVGGAIKKPYAINTLMCQTDLAATLLSQLDMPHSAYPFSRDVLSDTYKNHSAFHTYIDGFLFTDETGSTDYDNIANMAVKGTDNEERERKGKAILQYLYEYIDRL